MNHEKRKDQLGPARRVTPKRESRRLGSALQLLTNIVPLRSHTPIVGLQILQNNLLIGTRALICRILFSC